MAKNEKYEVGERDRVVFLRVPREVWKYIKVAAAHEEMSMNDIINELLISYKQKREKKLTNSDIMIS